MSFGDITCERHWIGPSRTSFHFQPIQVLSANRSEAAQDVARKLAANQRRPTAGPATLRHIGSTHHSSKL